jgi:hypothetical protein
MTNESSCAKCKKELDAKWSVIPVRISIGKTVYSVYCSKCAKKVKMRIKIKEEPTLLPCVFCDDLVKCKKISGNAFSTMVTCEKCRIEPWETMECHK